MAKQEEPFIVSGVVTDALANARFQVQLETGGIVLAHLSGNIRRFHIKVVPGDNVDVELSPYDLERGRIVYRKR